MRPKAASGEIIRGVERGGGGGLSFRVVRGCRRVDQAGVGIMSLSHRALCETNIALTIFDRVLIIFFHTFINYQIL